MLAAVNPHIPEIKNLTFGVQFKQAEIAGSWPEFYSACQRVNARNQSVYTGGLRPGGLLPLCPVAGGVGASLQANRKQVESREWRNAVRCSGSSGLLSLQGGGRKLSQMLKSYHSKMAFSYQTGNISHALSLSQDLLDDGKALQLISFKPRHFNYKTPPVRILQWIL